MSWLLRKEIFMALLAMVLPFFLISSSIQGITAQKDYSQINVTNYTSCEKFLENTTFDPMSIVDVDWRIFYFWSPHFEESYDMRFTVPSEVLIDRFRVEVDTELKPPVNWSNAVLFMESTIDFSALIVKTDVPGIFIVVPTVVFEYSKAPVMTFALKLVEPGYLGILNCEFRVCYALSHSNKLPHHTIVAEEAKKLGFWNDFGRSHLGTIPPIPTFDKEPFDLDDDDEDENLEIINRHHNIQFL